MSGMDPLPPRRLLPSAAILLVAGACWLAAPAPAAAQTHDCPAFDAANVTVSFRNAPLRRAFDRSIQQLARMPGRAPGPAGAGNGHILGLAHAVFEQSYDIGVSYGPVGGGAFCGALTSLDVTFGTRERAVYVAKELPRNTCIHREVLDHEMHHVQVDEALMKEFLPTVKRRLATLAGRMGTVRARSQQQVMASLRKPIDAELKKILNDFTREREKRQARIDTLDEYDRVSRSCGGELAKYVKGKGKF